MTGGSHAQPVPPLPPGPPSPEAAARVCCPAPVVLAANDIMTPTRNGVDLARLIPDSRTVTIPDFGHLLLAEWPDATLNRSPVLRAGGARA